MKARHFFIFAALLLAIGCGPKADSSLPANAVQDDLGRSVAIRADVKRVISLAPSITEMVYAVGAGDKLVGVTTYCNYPEAANSVQKVGDTMTPDLEKIVALRPDVILISTDSQLEAFMRMLDERGIAVYVIQSKDIDDVLGDMERLGELLGTKSEATAAVGDLRRRVESATSAPAAEPLKVFVQISREPLFTIGADSFITKLVAQAGAVSVTKDIATAYPKLSKETAAAANPDVIILSESDDNREPNDALKNSNAVKNGRVFRIPADVLSRPGPRSVDALEQMAKMMGQVRSEVK